MELLHRSTGLYRKEPFMRFSSGLAANLAPELVARHAHYRYRVFVEKLGWDLQTHDGLEVDQFDRDDTLYVVALDADDDVIGTARLLPTTRPYLLAEVFPQLLGTSALPHSPAVWELSRFAAVDFDAPVRDALAQFSSPTTVGLLQATLRAARQRGVERLLRNIGVTAWRAAPPQVIDGQPLLAIYIATDPQPPSRPHA
jgi:acyl homoserine lactone synthase